MRSFILIFAALFSTFASAQETRKYCVPGFGCLYGTSTSAPIYMSSETLNQIPQETRTEFHKAGHYLQGLTAEYLAKLEAQTTSVNNLDMDNAREELDGLALDAIESSIGCGMGVLGCVGATAGALEAPPIFMLLAKITCGGVGAQCGVTSIRINEWLKKKAEIKKEKDKAAAAARMPEGGHASGGSGGGHPGPGVVGGGGSVTVGGGGSHGSGWVEMHDHF